MAGFREGFTESAKESGQIVLNTINKDPGAFIRAVHEGCLNGLVEGLTSLAQAVGTRDHEADALHARQTVGRRDGPTTEAAYFELFPGVWRQGDWIRFSERGSCEVTGRSDATSTAAASASARASSSASSRSCRRSLTASSSTSRTTRRSRGARALRRSGGRLRAGRRAARRHGPVPALGALTAPRARPDPCRAFDPPHVDGQELETPSSASSAARQWTSRQQGLAPRPDRSRHLRRARERWPWLTPNASPSRTPSRSTSTPTSRCREGGDSLPDELATQPISTSAAVGKPHGGGARPVLPRAADDGGGLHGRRGVVHGAGSRVERGDRGGREANADVLIPFASIDPTRDGAGSTRRGA